MEEKNHKDLVRFEGGDLHIGEWSISINGTCSWYHSIITSSGIRILHDKLDEEGRCSCGLILPEHIKIQGELQKLSHIRRSRSDG